MRVVAVVLVVVAVVVLWRLALAAERRGWIRLRGQGPGTAAAALQAMSHVLEPASEHVVVEHRRARREDAEDGDPPDGSLRPTPG